MNLSNTTALILIDVQKYFDEPSLGNRNNPQAEQNMARILNKWRQAEMPIIHIQHISDPSKPHNTGREFKEIVKPLDSERIIVKNVNSAFIGTNLENTLRKLGSKEVVIVGLTTDHCVSTTTRMAANLGFSPILISDATATFERIGHDGKLYSAENIHQYALVQLHEEFAVITDTDSLLGCIS